MSAAADNLSREEFGQFDADVVCMQAMLNPEWRLRPTAESVLKHPWLSGTSLAALQSSSEAQS